MSWGIFSCLHCQTTQERRRHKQKYCTASCQLKFEYANGLRNRDTITRKAHDAIREKGFPERKGKLIPQLHNQESYKKISKAKTGKPVLKLRGANHPNWTGGKDKSYWKSADYQAWRKFVMQRDNYTCIQCGDDRGGNLEVDHILPVSLFPEKMLDLANGRTLCKPCHYMTPTWGTKCKKLTREQLIPVIEG